MFTVNYFYGKVYSFLLIFLKATIADPKKFPEAANTYNNGLLKAAGDCVKNLRNIFNTNGFLKPCNIALAAFETFLLLFCQLSESFKEMSRRKPAALR
jgi:hypothetical protein